MRITDDRYHRDLRRFQLALRLIQHEARTHTICAWTGLSSGRVRNFFHTYGVAESGDPPTRRRGPPPHRIGLFLRSPATRTEAAAVASLCRLFGVLPIEHLPNARRTLPSVARGEHLCSAYEFYRACVPSAQFSLEQVMLLTAALAEGVELDLGHCARCHAAILIDRCGPARYLCAHCQRENTRSNTQ